TFIDHHAETRMNPSRDRETEKSVSFDLFEIEENHIRIIGDTAVVTGTYRNIVRVRGKQNPLKHARQLRVYVQSGGRWKLMAHQATAIAPVIRNNFILPIQTIIWEVNLCLAEIT